MQFVVQGLRHFDSCVLLFSAMARNKSSIAFIVIPDTPVPSARGVASSDKEEPEKTDLPKDVDGLPAFFSGKGLMHRDDMWNYFMDYVDSDHYFDAIMDQIKAHKMLKPFEAFISEKYEMVGWDIHADQEPEEFIHTISDFVHYLMIQPLTSPLTLSQVFDLKQSENMEEQEINGDGEADTLLDSPTETLPPDELEEPNRPDAQP